MSRVSSALFISCSSGTGRPLRMPQVASYFVGSVTNQQRSNDDLRRNDELDDEFETCGFAGPGCGAAACRTGRGDGAGWAARGARRCSESGGCDEGAGQQEIQRRKGFGAERGGDLDGYGGS